MSTLQKTDDVGTSSCNKSQNASSATVSVSTVDQPIENLLTREWLLTNGRGGYSSSTIAGCNTRAYHGLLIGSLEPPANRVMALANCLEMIILRGEVFNLSTFEFSDKFAPAGFRLLMQFRRDIGTHFDYKLEKVELTKSIYLLRNTDTLALVYDLTSVQEPVEFVSRPFVGLRDFHTLQKSHARLSSRQLGCGVAVRHDVPNSCELSLSCLSADFEKDQQWWFDFVYRTDRERGQNFTEDLWTPGFFKCRVESPTKIVLWAQLTDSGERRAAPGTKRHTLNVVDTVRRDLWRHQESLKRRAANSGQRTVDILNTIGRTLCLAADEFIVSCDPGSGIRAAEREKRTTILAGYPWFADWGRDAFIALPGLLLCTGRFDEAKSVLTTFAAAADEGMIPNRFDDRSGIAHFNSVDASLWFINAAFQYQQACGDSETFMHELMPTIRSIIDSYCRGTRFGIRADADGLITAGDDQTQLTWMDARYDGVALTPRYGKAVEINALWYNCLMQMKNLESRMKNSKFSIPDSEFYKSMADKVRSSFRELFWNESKGYLNDCILPDGSVDDSLRPNQIFAVSLGFSPLSPERQKSVVDAVQNQLVTPYGLRTLSPAAASYKGKYTGPQPQRDAAYHQGTVWPYLIGPFVESFLKVNEFSKESKDQAAELIQPLLEHLTEDGCLGSVSEIFDGDAPHYPRGCFAQAWSVAELIRAYQLINS